MSLYKPIQQEKPHLKDIVDTVENLDIKQQIVPIKSTKRNRVLKETRKERDIGICQKLNDLTVVNMDILHKNFVQKHIIMLILLKKVSKTRK